MLVLLGGRFRDGFCDALFLLLVELTLTQVLLKKLDALLGAVDLALPLSLSILILVAYSRPIFVLCLN